MDLSGPWISVGPKGKKMPRTAAQRLWQLEAEAKELKATLFAGSSYGGPGKATPRRGPQWKCSA
eukprot:8735364-Karenia_brevis.AAC.1